jgi:pimeloyl-ACP methyl ester carboxylesterase
MRETEVAIPADAITLAGTMATPDGEGPYPTALLLAGSGELDRDGNHKKFRLNTSHDLAVLLAAQGWASLRFDKRGVGASGGDYLSAGFFDELDDAHAAYRWLRGRGDAETVVLIGHSLGTLMSLEIADREPDVDGAILLAATTKTGEETLAWQTDKIGENIVPGPIKALLRLFRTSVGKQQRKAVAKLKATTTDTARIQLAKVNAKWMREFIAFDPMPTLDRATIPLLAITGSKDVQVDPADLAIISATATQAEVIEVPDVDHILRLEPGPFSNPRHYGKQLKKPIDSRVTESLVGWLGRHRRPPTPQA